jgi:hypothetical protein
VGNRPLYSLRLSLVEDPSVKRALVQAHGPLNIRMSERPEMVGSRNRKTIRKVRSKKTRKIDRSVSSKALSRAGVVLEMAYSSSTLQKSAAP